MWVERTLNFALKVPYLAIFTLKLENTSTPSRTFRRLFTTLQVRWLSHIFNRNACIYQTASRWDFTTLSNYHLIDWWSEVCFSLFIWEIPIEKRTTSYCAMGWNWIHTWKNKQHMPQTSTQLYIFYELHTFDIFWQYRPNDILCKHKNEGKLSLHVYKTTRCYILVFKIGLYATPGWDLILNNNSFMF